MSSEPGKESTEMQDLRDDNPAVVDRTHRDMSKWQAPVSATTLMLLHTEIKSMHN